jgi:hypothetical protein
LCFIWGAGSSCLFAASADDVIERVGEIRGFKEDYEFVFEKITDSNRAEWIARGNDFL